MLRCTTTRANSHHRTSARQTSIRSGGSSRLPPHVRRRVGGHLLQSSGARADQVLARWVAPWSAALPASVAAAERTGMAVVPCHRASCGACLARPGRGAAGRRACRPRASATHCRPHVTLCPRRARPGGVCDGILACNHSILLPAGQDPLTGERNPRWPRTAPTVDRRRQQPAARHQARKQGPANMTEARRRRGCLVWRSKE